MYLMRVKVVSYCTHYVNQWSCTYLSIASSLYSIHLIVFIHIIFNIIASCFLCFFVLATSLLLIDLIEPVHNVIIVRLLFNSLLALIAATFGVLLIFLFSIPMGTLQLWILSVFIAQNRLFNTFKNFRYNRCSQFFWINLRLLNVFSS